MRNGLIILFLACSAHVWSEERTNPFANPNMTEIREGGEANPLAPPELKLKAVLPSASNALANINGKLMRLGDTYQGYVLTHVTTESVTLTKNDQSILLELRPTGRWLAGDPS